MRIVLDSATYPAIAQINCLKFGLLNGPAAWTDDQLDEQRRAGQLLALVDVEGGRPDAAAVVDWTAMTPKDPQRLIRWVEQRNLLAHDAVIMCVRDALPTVLQIMGPEYYRLLVVDLSASGEPPLIVPQYGLPPNVALLGCQYVQGPTSGGPYNLSILFDDAWHVDEAGVITAAAALHATAAAAVPAVNPLDVQAADELAAVAAAPKHAASPAGPTSSDALSAPTQAPVTWVGPLTPPDPAPFSISAADVVAAAAGNGQDPADVSHGTLIRTGPFAEHVEASTAAADPPAAAAGQIDHGMVWHWIQQGMTIAGQFRGADAGRTAAQLEDSLDQLLEVGKLLSELGR